MRATRPARLVLLLSLPLLPAIAFAQGYTFPVSRSPDGRYLLDAAGTPFPIMGRTAWFITSLTTSEYQLFLNNTADKGYNAFEFHVINHDPRGHNEPFAGNGTLPFLRRLNGSAWDGALHYGDIDAEAPDFATPNPSYWAHADALLAFAESRGLLAFMFPAYVGYAGGEQGWMQELVANGPARIESYGAWIAARYAARGNIVWMMGGDMGSFTPEQEAVEQALLDGLNSVPGQQSTFFSAEWDSGSIATDQPTFGWAMTLNGAYTWSGYTAYYCRAAYAYEPTLPAYLLEEPYDEEGPDGTGVNPSATQPVRRFQWWGWLGSIGGYIAGNGYIWPFNPGWQDHLDTQGAQDMARLNAFITSMSWYNLVPSGLAGMTTIVTEGGGFAEWDWEYVAAAAMTDGTVVLAYIPPDHTGTIAIDMATLSAPVRARWFNPTTAVYTAIGTDLPHEGTQVFTPPGDNGSGFSDWVLVLDAFCISDLDGDRAIDLHDFAILQAGFGESCPAAPCAGDIDGDADVDAADTAVFADHFGTACDGS